MLGIVVALVLERRPTDVLVVL
jgi:hypothetical protein